MEVDYYIINGSSTIVIYSCEHFLLVLEWRYVAVTHTLINLWQWGFDLKNLFELYFLHVPML